MTGELGLTPALEDAPRRARLSIAHGMAVVASAAAVSAFFVELTKSSGTLPLPMRPIEYGGAGTLTTLVIITGLGVAALRESRFFQGVLGTGLAAGSLALYGGVRGTTWGAFWAPLFVTFAWLVPLWARRALPNGSETPTSRVVGGACQTGLNAAYTVLGLALVLMMVDMVSALLPAPPAAPTGLNVPAVLPSPSYVGPSMVVPASATLPPPPIALPGPALPEFAPPPPSVP